MFEFLKTKSFTYLFSFLLGLGIMSLLRPICKGDSCLIQKAPDVNEITSSTYQLGSKCYQFKTEPVDCPSKGGAIEAFEMFAKSS